MPTGDGPAESLGFDMASLGESAGRVPDRERETTLRNTFACEMERMKGGSAE